MSALQNRLSEAVRLQLDGTLTTPCLLLCGRAEDSFGSWFQHTCAGTGSNAREAGRRCEQGGYRECERRSAVNCGCTEWRVQHVELGVDAGVMVLGVDVGAMGLGVDVDFVAVCVPWRVEWNHADVPCSTERLQGVIEVLAGLGCDVNKAKTVSV